LGRVEIDIIGQGNAVENIMRPVAVNRRIDAAAVNAAERPIAIGGAGNVEDARRPDDIVRFVEISVVHRHRHCVGRVLIDQRIAAVTKVSTRKSRVGHEQLGPIILRAAKRKITIRRMKPKPLKLRCAK